MKNVEVTANGAATITVDAGDSGTGGNSSDLLFSGDTLFPGGPGNTKLEGADFPTIIRSIEERLFSRFKPDTIVLPGHGTDTTIGNESPHLQEWIDRGW